MKTLFRVSNRARKGGRRKCYRTVFHVTECRRCGGALRPLSALHTAKRAALSGVATGLCHGCLLAARVACPACGKMHRLWGRHLCQYTKGLGGEAWRQYVLSAVFVEKGEDGG